VIGNVQAEFARNVVVRDGSRMGGSVQIVQGGPARIIGIKITGDILFDEQASYSAVHGQLDFTYVLIATVEETIEMLGSAVLVYALLAYVPIGFPDAVWRLRVAVSGWLGAPPADGSRPRAPQKTTPSRWGWLRAHGMVEPP
jgi:hypothetical protein